MVFLPLASPRSCSAPRCWRCSSTAAVNTGFVTIIIAHVMFTVSYVVVTVKARLEGMDRHIEEAAMDLGATEWATFRKITLPMIAPGVAAAALLAAAISIDDYVITSFNAGQTQTFPLFIFGATRRACARGQRPRLRPADRRAGPDGAQRDAAAPAGRARDAARDGRRALADAARAGPCLSGPASSSTSAASGTATRRAARRGCRCRRSSGRSGWPRRSARWRARACCARSSA